jgi:ubiquinone/menaquinone biosynthesis C-methylase UbiE
MSPHTPATNATARFSNRVADYIAARPGYPHEVVQHLERVAGFTPGQTVLDLGSGTGLSAIPFLNAGYHVIGVEPNANMRAAGDQLLTAQVNFSSVLASADSTTLPSQSADLAIAGQAFHWFNRGATRVEMQRVLKPNANGHRTVALLFNDRRTDSSPFLQAYEALLHALPGDYARVNHKQAHAEDQVALLEFFSATPQQAVFYNEQRFDFEGFVARVSSSSYAPSRESADYLKMLHDLELLFAKHAINDRVVWEYDCRVIWGHV